MAVAAAAVSPNPFRLLFSRVQLVAAAATLLDMLGLKLNPKIRSSRGDVLGLSAMLVAPELPCNK